MRRSIVLAFITSVAGACTGPYRAAAPPAEESSATDVVDSSFSWPAAFRNPVVVEITIDDGDLSLRSDGGTPYKHRHESVVALMGDAASLWSWRGTTTADNSTRTDAEAAFPRRRYLQFDLSNPVPGSGATSLGVVRDSVGKLHLFFREDLVARRIIGLWQAPVGQTVQDDRVEFWMRHDGHQYLLQFGPWGMGKYSPRGQISGDGSTPALVTRTDSLHWHLRSASNSVGRLWNIDDIQNPKDSGLYYFSFSFAVQARPDLQP